MKKRSTVSILSLLITLFVTLLIQGCDSDLAGINDSPNAILDLSLPTREAMQSSMIALQAAAGDWYSDERSRILSVWTMHMCAPPGLGRPQPVSWNTYKMVRDEHPDRAWIQAYRVVKVANDIINTVAQVGFQATATIDDARMTRMTRNTMLGIAKFHKALALGEVAALYGDIPISVAIKAEDPPPTFVKQSAAYAHVQTLLDEAIVHFSDTTVTIPQDLNFGPSGNAPATTVANTVNATHRTRWVAACNSLKARYYLHVKSYGQAASSSAASGISAATGTVFSIHSTTVGEYSPWAHWSQFETGEPLRGTKYYIDLLKSEAGDTRLAAYFAVKGGATAIVGYDVYGDLGGAGDELNATRAAGLVKYRPTGQPFPLISYQENLLINAEADAQSTGAINASALANLNTIRTGAGLTTRTAGSFANTGAFITEILKQKYLQLHLEGQAYHDMRRTGTRVKSGIPIRWIYGQNEYSTNPNVPKPEPTANEVL